MNQRDIQELFMIVKSIEASKQNCKQKKGYEQLDFVVKRCEDFCKDKDINITHGSAFKEIRHKYYYYWDKYLIGIRQGDDLYSLYKDNIISAKEIVFKLLKIRSK